MLRFLWFFLVCDYYYCIFTCVFLLRFLYNHCLLVLQMFVDVHFWVFLSRSLQCNFETDDCGQFFPFGWFELQSPVCVGFLYVAVVIFSLFLSTRMPSHFPLLSFSIVTFMECFCVKMFQEEFQLITSTRMRTRHRHISAINLVQDLQMLCSKCSLL